MAESDSPPEDESLAVSARNSRYGIALFALYLLFYGGFMAINVLSPATMAMSLGGMNVAIWYGFGLIVAALVLALIYMWLCSAADASLPPPSDKPDGKGGA